MGESCCYCELWIIIRSRCFVESTMKDATRRRSGWKLLNTPIKGKWNWWLSRHQPPRPLVFRYWDWNTTIFQVYLPKMRCLEEAYFVKHCTKQKSASMRDFMWSTPIVVGCLIDICDSENPIAEDRAKEVKLIRPLLQVRKHELKAYCLQEGLSWLEDPTNKDTAYLRNLIRARLASETPDAPKGTSMPAYRGQDQPQDTSTEVSSSNLDSAAGGIGNGQSYASIKGTLIGGGTATEGASLLQCQAPVQEQGSSSQIDIVKDILLMTSVCSEARKKMHSEASLLLGKLSSNLGCAGELGSSKYGIADRVAAEPLGKEAISELQPIFLNPGEQWPLYSCSMLNLRPFIGSKRGTAIRVLARLLQVPKSRTTFSLRGCSY